MAMAEYIERKATYKRLMNNKKWANSPSDMEYAAELVLTVPAADVVEVVRCKDCRNFGEDVGMSKDGVWARCFLHKRIMCERDFCSYGEKMDGKGDAE